MQAIQLHNLDNMRSLSKLADDTASNDRIICNKIYRNRRQSLGNNVAGLDKFNINGVSIFSFKKYVFANRVFTLMFVNRKLSSEMQTFSQLM